MAVFILETYNASGRLWAILLMRLLVCHLIRPARLKTGEGPILCLEEVNYLVCLPRFSLRLQSYFKPTNVKCLFSFFKSAKFAVFSMSTSREKRKINDAFFKTWVTLFLK